MTEKKKPGLKKGQIIVPVHLRKVPFSTRLRPALKKQLSEHPMKNAQIVDAALTEFFKQYQD